MTSDRSKKFIIVIFYSMLLCCPFSVAADDFIEDDGILADDEQQVEAGPQDPEGQESNSDDNLDNNASNPSSSPEVVYVGSDYKDQLDDVIKEVKSLNEKADKLYLSFEQYSKSYQEHTAASLKKSGNETVEITLSDLHDDNYKVMAVVFIGVGLLLGFFIISKVLL